MSEHPPDHEHRDGDHPHGHGLLATVRSLFGAHHHDAGHPLDSALATNARGIRAIKLSLLGLGVTAVAQLGVVWLTGSVALLSDTLHNFADAATALPMWLAFTVERRRANRRFPYGYGRAEDLAGLVIVLMITASAVLAAWQAVDRLINPQTIRHVWVVAAAGVIGFAGNELVARYRLRVGEEIGSSALVADGLHARTDSLTSLGVVAGAVGVAAGWPAADGVVGLVIAAIILRVLFEAARDVFLRLMDGIDPALLDQARDTLAAVEGVLGVGQLRMRWIGHRLHAEVCVTVPAQASVVEGHDLAERARHALLHDIPHLASAMVHADPDAHEGQDHHADLAHHPSPFEAAGPS